jgi:dolichyl-phosphate beta-glucosyltransferase
MREARGDVRVYTDVDLPFGSECIRLMEHFIAERGFHVVIGDRTLEASRYSQQVTLLRRLASAVFTTLVGRVITGGFFDTQCGVKGFRSDVAERLFLLSRIDRFAFDVELVYMSLKHRLDIKRLAVELERNETSSVRVVRDSLRMLVDVARIVVNQYRGRYRDDYLLALITHETRAAQVTIRSRRPS